MANFTVVIKRVPSEISSIDILGQISKFLPEGCVPLESSSGEKFRKSFLNFSSKEDAAIAVTALNGQTVWDSPLEAVLQIPTPVKQTQASAVIPNKLVCSYDGTCLDKRCSKQHPNRRPVCELHDKCRILNCSLFHDANRPIQCKKGRLCCDVFCSSLHEANEIEKLLMTPKYAVKSIVKEIVKVRTAHLIAIIDAKNKASRFRPVAADGSLLGETEYSPDDAKVVELVGQLKSFDDVVCGIWISIIGEDVQMESGKNSRKSMMSRRQLFRELHRLKAALPALALRSAIVKGVLENPCVVIKGATGSGKSTQATQYLAEMLGSGQLVGRRIICTQPRKVAAISLANRVAEEWSAGKASSPENGVGVAVGYRAGSIMKSSSATVIDYQTEGTLLSFLLRGSGKDIGPTGKSEGTCTPTARAEKTEGRVMKLPLADVAAVILDEAHERSVTLDILIGVLLDGQTDGRWPHLKLIVTSATLDTALFSKYLNDAPVISIPGRMFPVTVLHLPQQDAKNIVAAAVRIAVEIHCTTPLSSGDILVFLTGAEEVTFAVDAFTRAVKNSTINAIALPLFGRQQPEEQAIVFVKPDAATRKIVFSTDVAETSITIDGVRHVVDSGLSKESVYDPRRNVTVLETRPISRSSAEQRKGRAGRTAPGICYRLYSQDEEDSMRVTQLAEVLSKPLELTVITLRAMGLSPLEFNWIERPNEVALRAAENDLCHLGALVGPNNSLSDLGKLIADLQIDPALARVVFCGCKQGAGEAAAILAGLLSVGGNIFWRRAGSSAEEKKLVSDTHAAFFRSGGDAVTLYRLYKFYEDVLEGRTSFSVEKEEEKYESFIENHLLTTSNQSTSTEQLAAQLKIISLDDVDGTAALTAQPFESINGGERDEDTSSVSTTADTDAIIDSLAQNAAQLRDAVQDEVKELRAARATGSRKAKAWCASNFINSKSLGIAMSTARDLVRAAKSLEIWKEREQGAELSDLDIRRLVARGYLLNVAKMSGGSSVRGVNYSILRTDRMSTGLLHPGSAMTSGIRDGEDAPHWIVFQSVLQTSRTFLSLCTPIEECWIEEDAPEFAKEVRQRSVIVPSQVILKDISSGLMRKLMGKGFCNLPILEGKLGADIVADSQNNRIVVWCPSKNSEGVRNAFVQSIGDIRRAASSETWEELLCGTTRAVFGAGCEVLHLLSGNAHISINIPNLPDEITNDALKTLGERYGSVREVCVTPCRPSDQRDGVFGRIVYSDPGDATRALEGLRGELFGGKILRVSAGGVRSPTATVSVTSQLIMSWSMGPSKGTALLSFESHNLANSALDSLKRRPVHNGVEVQALGCSHTQTPRPGQNMLSLGGAFTGVARYASASEEQGTSDNARGKGGLKKQRPVQYQLRLSKLRLSVDEDDILKHLARDEDVGIPSYCRVERKTQPMPTENTSQLQFEVETVLLPSVPMIHAVNSSTSFFQQDKNRAGLIVQYKGGADDVEKAYNMSSIATYPRIIRQDQPTRIDVRYTTTLSVNSELWKAMEGPLSALQSVVEKEGAIYRIFEKGPSISVVLTVTNRQLLDAFAGSFSRVMTCTVFIPCGSKDLLFTTTGRAQIANINKNITYVHTDNATRVIRVYGSDDARRRGVTALEEAQANLSSGLESKSAFVLRAHWKALFKKRSDLIKSFGLLELTINGMKLTAMGPRAALDALFLELQGCLTDDPPVAVGSGSLLDCPICWCPIEDDNFELSVCSHLYCTSCLQRQFSSADKQGSVILPVRCCATGCISAYSWSDIVALAPQASLPSVKYAAVEKFILSDIESYRHCVVPACPQILDLRAAEVPHNDNDEVRLGGKAAHCDSCGHSYCLFCSDRDLKPVAIHKGSTCAMSAAANRLDVLVHVNRINDLLCLKCPQCKAVFTDFTGCYALTCSCHCVFCAFCLKPCTGDPHDHVRFCAENGKKGEISFPLSVFTNHHKNRLQTKVSEYLLNIRDLDLKQHVIRLCAVSFRDLNIKV